MPNTIGKLSLDGYTILREEVSAGFVSPEACVLLLPKKYLSINVSGYSVEAEANSIILIRENALLSYKENVHLDDLIQVHFQKQLLPSSMISSLLSSPVAFFERKNVTEPVKTAISFLEMLLDAEDFDSSFLGKVKVQELLFYLNTLPKATLEESKATIIISYFAKHYKENISLDTLCEVADISKFYMVRSFAKETGLTPHAYLNYMRFLASKELLAAGMNSKEVAKEVGYQDYTTFFRTYKKITGIAPSDYQKGL